MSRCAHRCALALVLALGLLSCSTTLHPVTVQDTSPTLAFLRDGETTEARVVERLGQVYRRFSEGVLVYRFEIKKKLLHFRWADDCSDDCYDLILVFDPSGILKVHSLLRVQ